jgi:uncharacterized membrane protein
MIEPILLLKFLHVVSSALLFGGVLSVSVFVSLAATLRRGVLSEVARLATFASWIAAGALVTQPLTGLILLRLQEDSPMQPWLVATYGLFLLVLAAWIAATLLLRRLARSGAAATAYAPWAVLSWGAAALLVCIYFLMIAQPALWGGG